MAITVVNPAEPIDYSSLITPSSYVCGCGKSGVKLWRDYQTFLEHQTLHCADCAAETSHVDISNMQEDGKYPGRSGGYTDQIDWLIPAVPTAENDTFWGYTSTPQDGYDWWARLPVR